ncbi:CoA ester lyase [Burkholderia sp. Bp9143]|nr:CoA ester lyase [Burkholderia sp. Bp9143]
MSTVSNADLRERRPLRSFLFVPGDSERKLEKAANSLADALILDLEDSVAPSRTSIARAMVLEYLHAHRDRSRQQLWVRINALSSPAALLDLVVASGAPDGIMLPKVESPSEVARLGHMLDALEVRDAIARGSIGIIPVTTETPIAMFALGSYKGCSDRLAGLTWGAEDLAAALGASTNRGPDGEYDQVYQLARSLCLTGAAAAGVQPIDTIWGNFTDEAGLQRDCLIARQRGFTGKIAIHPAQVPVINKAFTPSDEELSWSRRVIEAFGANPEIGVVGLDGQMLDMPHLKQAQRIVALCRSS